MSIYYCRKCGSKNTDAQALGNQHCIRHFQGPFKGPHMLYEGVERPSYQCKYCGRSAGSIASLTEMKCHLHPDGCFKGHHEPQ